MNSELYNKVEKFVIDSFQKSGRGSLIHYQRTAYWAGELTSNADDALFIAAVSHDIERAFTRAVSEKMHAESEKGFRDEKYLEYHTEKGAQIMGDFLKTVTNDSVLIERVQHLIRGHEIGGDEDQNVLKDADSVSFFENNADYFVTKKAQETSKKKVKEKLDWMFNRITSDKAKEIARPWHEEAIKQLAM